MSILREIQTLTKPPGAAPQRRGNRCAVLVALLVVTAPPESRASGWGGMLGFGSDNVHRGSSLTDGHPA